MSKPLGSKGEQRFPLLVWDLGEKERTLLKAFFSKCSEHQIEARPLINLLSTIYGNGVVAKGRLDKLERRISTPLMIFRRRELLAECHAAQASVLTAKLIITECYSLWAKVGTEHS